MTPAVSVEVAPARPADDRDLMALLRACSRALPAGACESGGVAKTGDAPAAVAHVTWNETGDAQVTVRLRDGAHDLTRELTFAAVDPELQRWRSVGLAIATIVDELQVRRREEESNPTPTSAGDDDARSGAAPVASTPALQPSPTKPVRPEPARPPASAAVPAPVAGAHPRPFPSANLLELGGLAGSGLVSGAPRGGIYARGAHDLANLPAFTHLRLAYSLLSSTSDPSVTWTELELGGGVYLTISRLRLEASGGLELVRTSASARAPETGAIDAAASWLPGAALSICTVWPAKGPVSALLGVRGSRIAREVLITNGGDEIGRVSAYSVGLSAAIRFLP